MTEFTPTRDTNRADEIDQYWDGSSIGKHSVGPQYWAQQSAVSYVWG
jgi:hypothetical protein